jgi:hypothetical protein
MSIGIANTNLGTVARWVDVEVVVKVVAMRGMMDKYPSTTGCETSLVGFNVKQEGPSGRVLVI